MGLLEVWRARRLLKRKRVVEREHWNDPNHFWIRNGDMVTISRDKLDASRNKGYYRQYCCDCGLEHRVYVHWSDDKPFEVTLEPVRVE